MKAYSLQTAANQGASFENALAVDVSGSDWTDASSDEFYPTHITVNVSGDVKMDLRETAASVTVYLTQGVVYGMRPIKIYQTGTDASGIVVWK